VRVGRVFLRRLRARAGESSLKRDSPRVQQLRFHILSNCCTLSPSSSSAPHCICAPLLSAVVVAMASLVHPERFQPEVALNLVRNLLGCRRSPEGSTPAPLPSAISPPGSPCSSSPTSPMGWCCRSSLSSYCCWRSSASNFSTSRPTPSSRRPSSPTCARCSWGWCFFR
jgi:hypothetical protein